LHSIFKGLNIVSLYTRFLLIENAPLNIYYFMILMSFTKDRLNMMMLDRILKLFQHSFLEIVFRDYGYRDII